MLLQVSAGIGAGATEVMGDFAQGNLSEKLQGKAEKEGSRGSEDPAPPKESFDWVAVKEVNLSYYSGKPYELLCIPIMVA